MIFSLSDWRLSKKQGPGAYLLSNQRRPQTRVDQLNQVIRLMVDCITKMRLTGPPDKEIAVLLRAAADELDQ